MESCLVVLSGGQDSATCLAWAIKMFWPVFTISFDYGQRHKVELDCATVLSEVAGAKGHSIIPINSLQTLGNSALVGSGNIEDRHSLNQALPASFVPGRNMLFLTLAGAKAFALSVHHMVMGVCQTDFSGYPDCRDTSIKAVQAALSLCLDYPISIHTPLMWKTKAETVLLMKGLGHLDWYAMTHTCYEGLRPPCGACPACRLRAKGFQEAGIEDPLLAR